MRFAAAVILCTLISCDQPIKVECTNTPPPEVLVLPVRVEPNTPCQYYLDKCESQLAAKEHCVCSDGWYD